MIIRRGLSYGVLILGIIFSAMVVAAFPDFYHHSDVETMMVWAQQWNHGWTEIYNTCPGCNYPLFGIFSTAGVFKLLAKVGVSDIAWGFRFFLAAVDGANVLLVFLLFRELRIKHAALWAGIIGLLPSSWVGGGVWGQIDGISHCMQPAGRVVDRLVPPDRQGAFRGVPRRMQPGDGRAAADQTR